MPGVQIPQPQPPGPPPGFPPELDDDLDLEDDPGFENDDERNRKVSEQPQSESRI